VPDVAKQAETAQPDTHGPTREVVPGGAHDGPAGVRDWFAEHGLGPAPDLDLHGGTAGGHGAELGPDEEPAEGEPGLAASRARGAAAEARAAEISRYPDTSWTEARDRLAKGFAPGAKAFEGVRRAGTVPPGAGTWMESARAYARSGSPWPAEATADADAAERKAVTGRAGSVMPDATQSWFDAQGAMASRARAAPARRLVTVVAVTHDAAGRVVGVRLVRPSGSAAHDAAALARAKGERGNEMGARFGATVAHWAYVTELFVTPVQPGAGLSFDANFQHVRPDPPLARSVRSRVELVALYDAARR
jgi:hypothetical protein